MASQVKVSLDVTGDELSVSTKSSHAYFTSDFLRDQSYLAQVNSKLQTSNPDIYAIGDVAAFPINNYGLNKLMRQEHVANCRQSAKHAVAAIMDPATPNYDYLPFFYSRIFDLGWQVWLPGGTCPSSSHSAGVIMGAH